MRPLPFFVLVLFGVLLSQQGLAQTYQPEKVKPKSLEAYERGIDQLKNGDYKLGVAQLLESVKADTNHVDAYLSLGGVFGELKQYTRSIQWYERARAKDTAYFSPYLLPYSINLAGDGQFAAALAAVEQFLAKPQLTERSRKSALYRQKCYRFALAQAQLSKDSGFVFLPENLGDSVNTPMAEYYPSVTVTDSFLVFTRRSRDGREDFFESPLRGKAFGAWSAIPGEINEEPRKGALTVSQDGEWMLFAGRFANGHFDLYQSFYTPQGWSEPLNMGTNINTEFWESSPALSPDKNELYFSSNRPGGFGGKDLYVSFRLPNGRWTPAENMGSKVNTVGDELAPFLHADNQTLYFTSDGLPGYGGSDLFVMRREAGGKWSTPENLGYPINTIENEGSMAVSADGKTAYYASDRSDTRGELDLYRFTLRSDLRPSLTFFLKGKVVDAKTGKALPSLVELINNQNAKTLMRVQTDETGMYFITLPTGNDFTLSVQRKGYLAYQSPFLFKQKQADSVYQKDIALQPLELNVSMRFNNIEFQNNQFELPATAAIELNPLVQTLKENPSLRVRITGHTDNVGKPEDNKKLSENRANAIVQYLVQNGIAANRLDAVGKGDSEPIADNKSDLGRARNRRTTLTIVQQ
ncbi:MAG: flagellar motor protein MotB [Sphingobacteriia bacterium]|nr:MAG: flagellar motor protein MotB [Sphingobacteriia bacterium]